MRTALDLDNSVLAQIKEQQRLQKNKTLGQLASELLAKALAQASAASATEPLAWTVQSMQARLDLEDATPSSGSSTKTDELPCAKPSLVDLR